jgi:hypothetical protein
MTSASDSGDNNAADPTIREFVISSVGSPTAEQVPFQDRVRFWLAVFMLSGMAVIAFLLIICVAAGWMTAAEAKELALMVVALFGIVAPIIGFYFAAKERG